VFQKRIQSLMKRRSLCNASSLRQPILLEFFAMRFFIGTMIVALLGGGAGLWRAEAEWRRVGDKVGDESLSVEVARGFDAITAFPKEAVSESGTISADHLPKAVVVGGSGFDFGTMPAGTQRSHTFRIRNDGNAPLVLEVLRSSCKCTIGKLDKNTLQPGEETAIELTWKVEGMLSEFSQTATIGTNDRRQQELQFAIHGKIGRTYVLDPEEIQLGEFSAKDKFEKSYKLYSFEETPLVLNAYWADSEQPEIAIHHEIRKLEPNEVAEYSTARYVADLTIEVSPGLPAGPINGQVHMEVGVDHIPLALRCTGACVSDLRILAGSNYNQKLNTLYAGRFTEEEGGSIKFHVVARTNEGQSVDLKLKSVEPAEAQAILKVELDEPIRKSLKTLFPVVVTVPKGTEPCNYSGSGGDNAVKLTFTTNLEGSNEIPLMIRFIVE
jgi:hypothetical protein